ncbi:MAG TPA: DNA mismatch repair protein MutS, partial [Elusimicrobiales bacterium]|nr:DNA mismatch repair protein MutS [Elusimicrobiales bacterium]
MRSKPEAAETPLMKQYQAVKALHPGAILFFRLGDFYEMFGDDAKTASAALGLLLTARHGTPMCGIPYHSSRSYIARLLKAGHKIAICEQIEQGDGKGLFRREVVRVITPGTVIEDELLDAKTRNHLVCVEVDIVGWALACVEVSTGDFWATQKLGDDDLRPLAALIARLSPSEILASHKTIELLTEKKLLPQGVPVTGYLPEAVKLQVPDSWPGRSIWQNKQLALKTALAASRYVCENEPRLSGVLSPVYSELSSCMQLDEAAVRTLELVSGSGGRAQTLWGVLDSTRTPMGSRLLREWILQPLAELHGIESRQQAVAELFENEQARDGANAFLSEISDIERIVSRSCTLSASPRDAAGLKKSLSILPAFCKWLESTGQPVQDITSKFEPVRPALEHLAALLDKALEDNPPPRISYGGTIKNGHSAELDELRAFKTGSGEKLLALEAREREATQINSLKVGYNSIFGYYIEVTKTHLAKVPSSYTRKQTLVNAERFITQELKELESKILGAEEKTRRLETHLFNELLKEVAAHSAELKVYSKCLSELDVLLSLAEAALKNDYVAPEIDNSRDLIIDSGRHPVAERVLP